MWEIVFDIEIIGFDFNIGDCIIELGCVEVIDCILIGKIFYVYINL